MIISKETDQVEIPEEKVTFSGGAPRFSFKQSLSGVHYAIKSGKEPQKLSCSFLLKYSDYSKLKKLRKWYKNGDFVEITIDNESYSGVITSLRWDDNSEVLRGQLDFTEVDEVIKLD